MELNAMLVVGGFAVVIGTERQVNMARETRINLYRELRDCNVIEHEMFQSLVAKVTIVPLRPSPVQNKK